MEPNELTDEEREILDLRKAHEDAWEAYEATRASFRSKVAEYLENGGSPTHLGRILGVTRGRIYQIRDSAPERAAS